MRKTIGGTVTDYFHSGAVVISEKQGTTWTDYIFFGAQVHVYPWEKSPEKVWRH